MHVAPVNILKKVLKRLDVIFDSKEGFKEYKKHFVQSGGFQKMMEIFNGQGVDDEVRSLINTIKDKFPTSVKD